LITTHRPARTKTPEVVKDFLGGLPQGGLTIKRFPPENLKGGGRPTTTRFKREYPP